MTTTMREIIVTADLNNQVDSPLKGGVITAIRASFSGDRVMDVTGRHAMPGQIATPAHLELPSMGIFSANVVKVGIIAGLAVSATMVASVRAAAGTDVLLHAVLETAEVVA